MIPSSFDAMNHRLRYIEIALQSAGDRRVHLLRGEADEAEPREHDPASHEARTDRKAAPIMAQAVWIEETVHKEAHAGAPLDRAETRSWIDGTPSGWRAFIAVFRREQTPACTAVSLHVGVGVILTARAPNRRRSLRALSGLDDAGPRSPNTRERKWTRPHCSSSSSWCC